MEHSEFVTEEVLETRQSDPKPMLLVLSNTASPVVLRSVASLYSNVKSTDASCYVDARSSSGLYPDLLVVSLSRQTVTAAKIKVLIISSIMASENNPTWN